MSINHNEFKCPSCGSVNISHIYEGNYLKCEDCGVRTSDNATASETDAWINLDD